MPFTIEKKRDSLYIDGLQKGSKETKIAIAKAMLKQDMSLEMIIKLTGLSKKEVDKLVK